MSRQEIHCWSTRSNLTEIMVMFQTTPPHEHQPPVSELVSKLEYDRFTVIGEFLKTHEIITTASAVKLWDIPDKTAQRLLPHQGRKTSDFIGQGKDKG